LEWWAAHWFVRVIEQESYTSKRWSLVREWIMA